MCSGICVICIYVDIAFFGPIDQYSTDQNYGEISFARQFQKFQYWRQLNIHKWAHFYDFVEQWFPENPKIFRFSTYIVVIVDFFFFVFRCQRASSHFNRFIRTELHHFRCLMHAMTCTFENVSWLVPLTFIAIYINYARCIPISTIFWTNPNQRTGNRADTECINNSETGACIAFGFADFQKWVDFKRAPHFITCIVFSSLRSLYH